MAIAIREFLGYEGFEVEWNVSEAAINVQEGVGLDAVSPDSLMVDIEGIHVGPTRNFTWYTEQALQGSVPTWTKPYLRPLIMHHNEKDGKIIGRIQFVTYTDKNTRSGTGALLFTANVPDKEGKEQIQDGRLKTVSIGATVHDCRCSICGHNIAEDGECEHKRGSQYNGKICYWMIYSMTAKELSYVIVPSDIYAHNIRIYKPSKETIQVAANYNSEGVLSVSEAVKIDPVTGLPIQENKVIDENGDDQPTPPVVPATTPADNVAEIAELQKKLDAAEANAKAQKERADKAEADYAEILEKNKATDQELNDTKVLLEQAQKGLKAAKDSLVVKEAEAIQERQLREAAETSVIELNAVAKNSLIENVVVLRKSLNKPDLGREELEKRSDESLKDAVRDLKEEFNNPNDVTKITPAVNPAITENIDQGAGVVKEEKNAGNMDLKEGLENVLNNMFRTHK